jgi:hypothetical protein
MAGTVKCLNAVPVLRKDSHDESEGNLLNA